MKKYLLYPVLLLPLSACYHDDVEPVEAKIDYPPLAAKSDFEAAQTLSAVELDAENAQKILQDSLVRLMNVVEIGNHLADEIAEGSQPDPVFKPMAREFKIVEASTEGCINPETDATNTQSLIWNDEDNNNLPSKGDEWFYIWEGCESDANSSVLTGVMSFTGMVDPFNKLGNLNDEVAFSNYQYSFDTQIDFRNGNSVYLDQTKIVFNREVVDSNEITRLSVKSGSKMGVKSGDDVYMFEINALDLTANEDNDTLELEIDSRYFDSSETINGYVDIITTEPLMFEYDLDLINPAVTAKLTSGNLELNAMNSETANLAVDEDDTQVNIMISSADQPETVPQTDFFDNSIFKLVNLTGLSN